MSALEGPRLHLRRTDSTNDRARDLAQAGAPSGTLVTAEEQSAGRGRHGRTWAAPPGAALLCSAILRPLEARHALLPLAVPLAVCEAAEALAPVECRVKWPNDVWLEERKLAGILIEARPPDWAVIGVDRVGTQWICFRLANRWRHRSARNCPREFSACFHRIT